MDKLTPPFSVAVTPSRPGQYLASNLSDERLVLWTGLAWKTPPEFAVVQWRGLICDHVWVSDGDDPVTGAKLSHCDVCGSTRREPIKRKPGRPRKVVSTPGSMPGLFAQLSLAAPSSETVVPKLDSIFD